MRLDHVQLAAPPNCEEQARAFYAGLLGLEEVPKPAPLASRGGAWFALNADQQLHVGVEAQFVAARKAHPALAVDDVALDRLARTFADAGVEVRWDASLRLVRRFYVDDPWGNRLELLAAAAVEDDGTTDAIDQAIAGIEPDHEFTDAAAAAPAPDDGQP
jgi:catechol 2,3-dioxygenase-like lactoylglutathione lyase family enzyme